MEQTQTLKPLVLYCTPQDKDHAAIEIPEYQEFLRSLKALIPVRSSSIGQEYKSEGYLSIILTKQDGPWVSGTEITLYDSDRILSIQFLTDPIHMTGGAECLAGHLEFTIEKFNQQLAVVRELRRLAKEQRER